MSTVITLEIADPVLDRANRVAKQTARPVQDVLREWLNRYAAEMPLELLSDAEILALCDMVMDDAQQLELSELLALKRESQLSDSQVYRLEQLLSVYRRGLVQKAEALKIAVSRGLLPPLSS
jgi:hypothetical protein